MESRKMCDFRMAVFVLAKICRYNHAAILMPKARPTKLRARTARATRGRPPVHQETWSKVSVVLFDRQIVHLDRIATDIRGKSGKVLNRAELIRALSTDSSIRAWTSRAPARKEICARAWRGGSDPRSGNARALYPFR